MRSSIYFLLFFNVKGTTHMCASTILSLMLKILLVATLIASAQALGKIDTTGIATRGIISQHKKITKAHPTTQKHPQHIIYVSFNTGAAYILLSTIPAGTNISVYIQQATNLAYFLATTTSHGLTVPKRPPSTSSLSHSTSRQRHTGLELTDFFSATIVPCVN